VVGSCNAPRAVGVDPELETLGDGRQEVARARPQLCPHADAWQAVQLTLRGWQALRVARQARLQLRGLVGVDLAKAR